MKSFYSPAVDPFDAGDSAGTGATVVPLFSSRTCARGRIAVYDAPSAAPQVEDVELCSVSAFIESVSSRVHELARSRGGSVPYTVIREIAENLIHADFREPVVSILDNGSTIRFADQGPGIPDKDKALLPGFTTANGDMKPFIRGVGSGLPIVREFLSLSGGALVVEDNLVRGSVVTIFARRNTARVPAAPEARSAPSPSTPMAQHSVEQESLLEQNSGSTTAGILLSTRQKHVLAVVLESGLAGPSLVSKELGVGISTAYRDLASLEDHGLISSESGKRTLTPQGLSYLGSLSNTL